MQKIVSVDLAATVVGVSAAWLRNRVPIQKTTDGSDGVVMKDAFDAATHYPRDERAEHRRMSRLRFER